MTDGEAGFIIGLKKVSTYLLGGAIRQSAAERRQQIAEAVLKIISEHGVHRLTAQEIAREVGVTDGALFRHFKDKQAIVQEAIAHFESLVMADFPPAEADPLERLGRFFVGRLTLLARYPGFHRLAFSDRLAEAAGAEGTERVQRLMGRSRAFVRECLSEAQAAGRVGEDISLDVLTWGVMGVMRGRAQARGEVEDPQRVWEQMATWLEQSKG